MAVVHMNNTCKVDASKLPDTVRTCHLGCFSPEVLIVIIRSLVLPPRAGRIQEFLKGGVSGSSKRQFRRNFQNDNPPPPPPPPNNGLLIGTISHLVLSWCGSVFLPTNNRKLTGKTPAIL